MSLPFIKTHFFRKVNKKALCGILQHWCHSKTETSWSNEQLNSHSSFGSLFQLCSDDNLERLLHLGVLTQNTPRLQVGLPLHLNRDRVEVVGGETSLGHFSQDSLSIHRVICGGEKRQRKRWWTNIHLWVYTFLSLQSRFWQNEETLVNVSLTLQNIWRGKKWKQRRSILLNI